MTVFTLGRRHTPTQLGELYESPLSRPVPTPSTGYIVIPKDSRSKTVYTTQ